MKTSTYLTKTDVALHCTADNLWLSKFDRVYDFTNLVRTAASGEVEALLRAAGTDVTWWFDASTQDFPRVTDELQTRYRLPYGLPMLHAKEAEELLHQGKPLDGTCWWRDEAYFVGLLGHERPLEIFNTLTLHRHKLMVCAEETLGEIVARYARFNSNALGYRWRFNEKDLQMDLTLDQNGVPDERAQFLKLGWPEDQWYIPCIVLIWKDQLI